MCLKSGEPEEVGISEEGLRRFDRVVDNHIKKGKYPGLVALIVRRGRIVKHSAYGFSSLYPHRERMTIDKLFDLASLTKVIATTTLVMKLIERGILDLDDSVERYLPEFKGGGKSYVTLRHLLTHTSGLPAHLPLWELVEKREEVYKYICRVKLEYKPGEKVVYSDLGFILLGKIVEDVSGLRLDELASQEIFEPLGMRDTFFNPPSDLVERCVVTEKCPVRKRFLRGEVHDENSWFMGGVAGHAGLFSTAYDVALFGEMIRREGTLCGVRILSTPSMDTMRRSYTDGLNSRRGLGWLLKSAGSPSGSLTSQDSFGHTGFTGTSLWIDPKYELTIVLLSNRVHPSRERRDFLRLRPKLHNIILGSLID